MRSEFVFVKVYPNSKKEGVFPSAKRLEIFVKEDTKSGLANERARYLLSKYLGISREKLVLVKGHKSPIKVFRHFVV